MSIWQGGRYDVRMMEVWVRSANLKQGTFKTIDVDNAAIDSQNLLYGVDISLMKLSDGLLP